MAKKAERLRMARKLDGRFSKAAIAARALDLSAPTYQAHENGFRGISANAAKRYADFYNVSIEWLLTGRGTPTGNRAPVVGTIGPGARIAEGFFGEGELQPVGHENCVCARIEDDYQFPLRRGWLIFWQNNGKRVPEDCIGHLCVVRLKDGALMMQEVRHGRTEGRYDLYSFNAHAPPSLDVELAWATRVLEIRPK